MRFLACLLAAILPLAAQEVGLAAGRIEGDLKARPSYTWQFHYSLGLDPGWNLTFAVFNEGHLEGHHRDGASFHLSRRIELGETGLAVEAGAGAYQYFDTALEPEGYRNRHRLKGIASAGLHLPSGGGAWRPFLQATRTFGTSHDTFALLGGIAYDFRRPDAANHRQGRSLERPPACMSLTLLGGRAVLNSDRSEIADAWMVELRGNLPDHPRWDWTASYDRERGYGPLSRESLALQGWYTRTHLGARLALGLGMGPLVSRISMEDGDAPHRTTRGGWRATLGFTWRFEGSPWLIRSQWGRTWTSHHRDADHFLTGFGVTW